ncbi:hypothetical protein NX059_002820 [Plenodomus lindquistii]|nr:hypothetical protein NX059_002820 [Plenodomus lindquistii]
MQIRNAEKSWQEEEMSKPEDQRYQHNFLEWIRALKEADALIYQVTRLYDDAPAWRKRWTPSSPYEMHRAYDCVYAHALGFIDDEHVAPKKVVEVLQKQLAGLRNTFVELAGHNNVDNEMRT